MKKLEEIYSQVPELDCKGLCHQCCHWTIVDETEVKNIKEKTGRDFYDGQPASKALIENKGRCLMLENERCTIHPDRPLICRLFGVIKKMKCPFGCKPKEWLPDRDASKMMAKVYKRKKHE